VSNAVTARRTPCLTAIPGSSARRSLRCQRGWDAVRFRTGEVGTDACDVGLEVAGGPSELGQWRLDRYSVTIWV